MPNENPRLTRDLLTNVRRRAHHDLTVDVLTPDVAEGYQTALAKFAQAASDLEEYY